MTQTLCIVDIESSGLELSRHHVFEVAFALRLESGQRESHCWWLAGVDLSTADPAALRCNGFYHRLPPPAEQTDPATVAFEVARLTAGASLVGWNPAFDAGFLDKLLRDHDLVPAWDHHLVALESLVAGYLSRQAQIFTAAGHTALAECAAALAAPPWSSNDLARAVGVDPGDYERHSAAGDVEYAAAVLDALGAEPAAWAELSKPWEARVESAPAAANQGPPAPPHRRRRASAPQRAPKAPAAAPVAPESLAVAPAAPQAPTTAPEEAPQPGVRTMDLLESDPPRAETPRPAGMPGPDEDTECYECGDVIEPREQAQRSWTRFRKPLCTECFKSWVPA